LLLISRFEQGFSVAAVDRDSNGLSALRAGVRCREALLAFTSAAQTVMPWSGDAPSKPKQADFKAWVDHICATALSGCQSAFKFGSDAILVQLLFRTDQSGLKQIDVPAAIHLTSDQL
jgi:hypothetical protein